MATDLQNNLAAIYSIPFEDSRLLRDMIGHVSSLSCGSSRYVFKLFRSDYSGQAVQSVEIMTYLHEAGVYAPRIIPTAEGERYCCLDTEKGRRIGVLYEYVDGAEPAKQRCMEDIGRVAGELHALMGRYGGALACHGKPFFVDRFIQVLEKMAYPHVDAFARHGEMLFNHIEHLPSGFCHGDFHTGNMLLDASGRYFVLDYDAAAWAFPAYDMATVCDMTDYFSLSEKKLKDGFAQTGKMVDRFLKGYCPYRGMSDEEISSVYSFIALRHFDIQATIIESLGPTCVSEEFIDDQLAWLMKWDLLVNKEKLTS